MSLPIVMVLLVVELALGLISRVAPQLNLMATGAPIRLLIGLFVLGTTLALVPDVVLISVEPALRLASRMAASLSGAR
jgi:flagellar biosynthetic protein FliR